jgi:hypothetical protein
MAAGGADDVPTVAEVVATVLDAAWDRPGSGDALTEAVRQEAAWTVLQHLVATLAGGGLHLPVAATVATALADAADRLEDRLDAGLGGRLGESAGPGSSGRVADRGWDHLLRSARLAASDPTAVDLGPLPVIPPGAPI